MCIVIDINTLSLVFNDRNKLHLEFEPVKKWIDDGRGYLVYGGTRYKDELSRAAKYLRLIRLMRDGGKAISIRDEAVDALEEQIKEKTRGTQCNDQHIIGLLGASHCSLLCSRDSQLFPFIKRRELYPKGSPRVKIYSSSRNSGLLVATERDRLRNVE